MTPTSRRYRLCVLRYPDHSSERSGAGHRGSASEASWSGARGPATNLEERSGAEGPASGSELERAERPRD
jgi:hypothetical protein